MLFRPLIHCALSELKPARRKIVGASICQSFNPSAYSQIVTPAIPTHSWMICNQMTSCTRRPMCSFPLPLPVAMDRYEVGIASLFSICDTARISDISMSAFCASGPDSPRSLPRIYRASSSRPTLTSHRGDSGKNQTAPSSTKSGMIWKPMGKRHRMGDVPPFIKDRPLLMSYGSRLS